MEFSFDRKKNVFSININTEQLQNSFWILHTLILTAKCCLGYYKVRIVSMKLAIIVINSCQ